MLKANVLYLRGKRIPVANADVPTAIDRIAKEMPVNLQVVREYISHKQRNSSNYTTSPIKIVFSVHRFSYG